MVAAIPAIERFMDKINKIEQYTTVNITQLKLLLPKNRAIQEYKLVYFNVNFNFP